MTVKEKLEYIRSNESETVLFPILQQLFLKKGNLISNITHGTDEFGKDLVLMEFDDGLSEEVWTSIVVKNRKSNNRDYEEGGEIRRQIMTSFDHPFEYESMSKFINRVIVVVNGSVSTQANTILRGSFHGSKYANVYLWNRDRLAQEIEKHVKVEFLGEHEFINNKFIIEQRRLLKDMETSKKLFNNLNIEDIEEVFVGVKTSYSTMIESEKKYRYDGYAKRNLALEDDSVAILNSSMNFIVHGLPTCGKSVLLKRIGLESIKDPIKLNAPFYLDLGKMDISEDFELKTLINDEFSKITEGGVFDRTRFDKVLILIDGVDEIKDVKSIEILCKQIKIITETLSIDKKIVQVILATRNKEIFDGHKQLSDFQRIELFPFNIGQALKLVKKLIPKEISKSHELVRALKSKQLSSSLTRTPLAITLMCILYRDDEIDLKELPANITELYNKFTDFYLNRWDVSKGISLQYKYEELRSILAYIAAEMQNEAVSYLTRNQLVEKLNWLSDNYDYEDLRDMDHFIGTLSTNVRLVIAEPVDDIFYFYNQSFQEYFASLSYDDSNEDQIIDNFFSELWDQSIVFYCGRFPRRNVFIEKIRTKIKPTDLGQKFKYLINLSRCIQAANLVDRNTKKNVIKSIIYYFNDFYESLIKLEKESDFGVSWINNTVLFILQFRVLINRLLNTKHLNKEDLLSHIEHILQGENEVDLSDVTKYCLAHLATTLSGDVLYLEYFALLENKDLFWDRILYVDIKIQSDKKYRNEKLFNRLKRKQKRNRDYIISQFESPAIKHFSREIEKGLEE